MIKLLVATNNPGKLDEIKRLLHGSAFEVISLLQMGIRVECPEIGSSFAEIARGKAVCYNALVMDASPDIYTVAEDSGLETEALDGKPGIYSARYSGELNDNARNTAKLLRELRHHANRKARFVAVAALAHKGRVIATFTGTVSGLIIDTPRGSNGFGYDPVFFYPPLNKTFAELITWEKNRVSHRAEAFRRLAAFLRALALPGA